MLKAHQVKAGACSSWTWAPAGRVEVGAEVPALRSLERTSPTQTWTGAITEAADEGVDEGVDCPQNTSLEPRTGASGQTPALPCHLGSIH